MQFSIFDGSQPFKIDKPIRLIELFAGYGSQYFALEYLGVNFESWKICEWAVKSIQAYRDAHFENDNTDYSKDLTKEQIFDYLANKGISANYNEPMKLEQIKRLGEEKARVIYNNIMATHNLVNIQQVKGKDLEIVNTDKYCYIMTYSFPCQDISSAGLGKGMEKGSGTRSGMLWEVERILDELKTENRELPQVLLMENVPEVIGTNNIKHFSKWLAKLESLGYHCKWEILNAKDYGVPQNRERCFMISVLGDYYYDFPQSIKLKHRLKDLLEDEVEERFYLSEKALNGKLNTKFSCSKLENVMPNKDGIMPTLCARDYKDPKCVQVAQIKGSFESNGRIYSPEGISPTITTCGGGNREPKILQNNLKEKLCNELIVNGKVQEYDMIRHNYTTNKGENCVQSNNECPTLDTRCDCLGVVVNDSPKVLGGIGEKKSNNGTQWYQQDRIYDDNIAISVTTAFNPYYATVDKNIKPSVAINFEREKENIVNSNNEIYQCECDSGWQDNKVGIKVSPTLRANNDNTFALTSNLRIRKLTPKECFRLMGVKDEDFEKIAENQSNASLYHLAGDSIVVDVLMAIFKEIL